MVLLSDEEILNQTNNILNHCELQPRFCSVHDIQDNASSICVAILERLLHQKLPDINRNPKCDEDYLQNASIFLEIINNGILRIECPNVSAQDLYSGDKNALSEILIILSKLIQLRERMKDSKYSLNENYMSADPSTNIDSDYAHNMRYDDNPITHRICSSNQSQSYSETPNETTTNFTLVGSESASLDLNNEIMQHSHIHNPVMDFVHSNAIISDSMNTSVISSDMKIMQQLMKENKNSNKINKIKSRDQRITRVTCSPSAISSTASSNIQHLRRNRRPYTAKNRYRKNTGNISKSRQRNKKSKNRIRPKTSRGINTAFNKNKKIKQKFAPNKMKFSNISSLNSNPRKYRYAKNSSKSRSHSLSRRNSNKNKSKIYQKVLNKELDLGYKHNYSSGRNKEINENQLIQQLRKQEKQRTRQDLKWLETMESSLTRELMLRNIQKNTEEEKALEKVYAEAKKLEKEYLRNYYLEYKNKFERLRKDLEIKTQSIQHFFQDQYSVLDEEREAQKKLNHMTDVSQKMELSQLKKDLKNRRQKQLKGLCNFVKQLDLNSNGDQQKLNKMISNLMHISQ